METTNTIPKWKAWLLAMRSKTLSAAVVPMAVGTALAWMAQSEISFALMFCAIVSAMLIQIGTNLVNDALDYKKGADTEKRLGPQRATQMGWLTPSQVLTMGIGCLLLAVACGIPLIYYGSWPIFWTLSISSLMGYLYTGGPKPLAYHGLGDPFVFIFFGPVATGAMYYIQTGTLTWLPILAGIQIGLICTTMIAINNLRDIKEDTLTEKRTLPVRFGKSFGRLEIAFLIVAAYSIGYIWHEAGHPGLALWPLITTPLALNILINIHLQEPSKNYNIFLGQASVLHLLWGITLTAGAVLWV